MTNSIISWPKIFQNNVKSEVGWPGRALSNSFLISSCKTDKQFIQGTVFCGHRILGEGGSRYGPLKVVPCRSIQGQPGTISEKFQNQRLQKWDIWHFEARSACYNISIFCSLQAAMLSDRRDLFVCLSGIARPWRNWVGLYEWAFDAAAIAVFSTCTVHVIFFHSLPSRVGCSFHGELFSIFKLLCLVFVGIFLPALPSRTVYSLLLHLDPREKISPPIQDLFCSR